MPDKKETLNFKISNLTNVPFNDTDYPRDSLSGKGFCLLSLEDGQKFSARSCVLSFGLENVVTSELGDWFEPLPDGSQ
jgi:hypothetical protein